MTSRLTRGFTLVELLVVVTIITLLVAMLLPSMETAALQARKARCLANLNGIGIAQMLYLQDFALNFPQIDNFPLLLGNRGKGATNGANIYAAKTTPSWRRPLTPYLGITPPRPMGSADVQTVVDTAVKIAECPSDLGDTFWDPNPETRLVLNTYLVYGNSYLPAFHGVPTWPPALYRADYVYAQTGVEASQKYALLAPATNKLLMGDFTWHGNRFNKYASNRWHGDGGHIGLRSHNYLFADGHALNIIVPIEELEIPPNGPFSVWRAADPGWKWW